MKKEKIDKKTKEEVKVADDKTFINNLYLMSRNKKYEYKMLVRTVRAMPLKKLTQFVKGYGISEKLITKMSGILLAEENNDNFIEKFTEFVNEEYERNK